MASLPLLAPAALHRWSGYLWAYHAKVPAPELAGLAYDLNDIANTMDQHGQLSSQSNTPEATAAYHDVVDRLEHWHGLLHNAIGLLDQKQRRKAAKEWAHTLQKAADNREGLAYRILKKEPPLAAPTVTHNGKTTVFPKHVLQDYANQWAKWWKEADHSPPCELPFDPEVPVITADQIRSATTHFRATTSAPDGLPPRSIALLYDQCTQALAEIFRIFEQHGWSTSERIVLTVLIPKKDGGLRPIALFRSLYRVYSKARAQEASRPGKELTVQQQFRQMGRGRDMAKSGPLRHRPTGPSH
jgi:hypothetical protein